jgi:hypothetical protein
MNAGIAESARRALYVLSHKERDRLEDTHCRYTPFRAISTFEWKRVENLVNCQQLLFTETEWHSKFGCNLCKICLEKHHRAFCRSCRG